jgi:glycosyltransferase involved in cell wall biosynthesis
MTTVSVVIPTYNRPSFLDGAVRTALTQTYDDLEVVVVDDGSPTSYAADIVDTYPDTVSCVEHETNRGLSAARNTGVEHATGASIAFLDDDDRWAETKLERQAEVLDADERIGLVTCLCTSVTPAGEVIHAETSAPSGDLADDILRTNCIGSPSRVLVRRRCFDGVGGFDETLPTKQDWDLYLRACQEWRVGAVGDHLCFRTAHESMSSSPASIERDYAAIIEKHERLLRERGALTAARAMAAERAGRAFLGRGDLAGARASLKRAFSAEPTKRRAALLALAHTHPRAVDTAVAAARYVRLRAGRERPDEATLAARLDPPSA